MLGVLKGAWKVGKFAARVIPVARDAFDDGAVNPAPQTKFDSVVVDIANLVRKVKAAREDGVISRDEAINLLVDVVMIVLDRLLNIKLVRE